MPSRTATLFVFTDVFTSNRLGPDGQDIAFRNTRIIECVGSLILYYTVSFCPRSHLVLPVVPQNSAGQRTIAYEWIWRQTAIQLRVLRRREARRTIGQLERKKDYFLVILLYFLFDRRRVRM